MGGLQIFDLLTDAYVGGWVGGFVKIRGLRNIWTTPENIIVSYLHVNMKQCGTSRFEPHKNPKNGQ